MKARLTARMIFDAAHRMPHYPKGSMNERWHGHTYEVIAVMEGKVDPSTGMLMDHATFHQSLMSLHDDLDHRALNDIPGLEYPTAEMIAKWIWDRLKPKVPQLFEVQVNRELIGINVSYRGED